MAGRVDGALETGAGKLRAGLRIDPSSGARLDWGDAAALATYDDALRLLIERLDIVQNRRSWIGAGVLPLRMSSR